MTAAKNGLLAKFLARTFGTRSIMTCPDSGTLVDFAMEIAMNTGKTRFAQLTDVLTQPATLGWNVARYGATRGYVR